MTSDAQTGISSRILNTVLGALFGALLFASQIALAGLPNIELVSLLILVWTRVFRFGALPGIGVFILLEGLIYGFSIWWISYAYIWFVLWGIVMLVPVQKKELSFGRKALAALGWAVLSGAYGFAFGALTAIPWLIRGGPSTAFAYWIAGIPFDVTHAIGNFAAALILSLPLISLLEKMKTHTRRF